MLCSRQDARSRAMHGATARSDQPRYRRARRGAPLVRRAGSIASAASANTSEEDNADLLAPSQPRPRWNSMTRPLRASSPLAAAFYGDSAKRCLTGPHLQCRAITMETASAPDALPSNR